MNELSLFTVWNNLPHFTVKNEYVIEISNSFLEMTEYCLEDVLNKNMEEVLRILKVVPKFDLKNFEEKTEYFLFTKSLEVRVINIKIINEIDKHIYVIKEIPNSRLEDKLNYAYQLSIENMKAIAIYSAPDLILLNASELYINFFNSSFKEVYGKSLYDFSNEFRGSNEESIFINAINSGRSQVIQDFKVEKSQHDVTYWDGLITPIKENGIVKYIVINVKDITDKIFYRNEIIKKNKVIELQKTELEAVLDNMIDGFAIIDENGKFIKLNESFRKSLEKLGNDFNKDSLGKIKYFDLEGRELTLEDLPAARISRGEVLDQYEMLIKGLNEDKYVSISGTPLYNKNGNFKWGVLNSRDITNHVNQSNMIKEQMEMLDAVIDNMSEGLTIVDKNGECIRFNKRVKEYSKKFNKANEKIIEIGKKLGEVGKYFDMDGNLLSIDDLPVTKVLKAQKVENQVLVVKHEDTTLYIELNAMPIFNKDGEVRLGVINTRNITKQVEYENLIIEQKEKLQAIFDNIFDVIFIFDKNGEFTFLNKELIKNFLNVDPDFVCEELKNYRYFDEDNNEIPLQNLLTMRILRGETISEYRMHLKGKNKDVYISVNGKPVYDKNGDFSFGVLCIRQITSQVEQEMIIKDQQDSILNAERQKNEALEKSIEMKDDFLSLVSHELRTPLNVISTAVQALNYLYKDDLTDKVKEYIGTIRQNTLRQLRLVNNLLDITRANSGNIKIKKRNIDVVFLTKSITESVQTYASQKDIRLLFVSDFEKRIIGIDDEKYERILLNLLSNAIKFTARGKCIKVKLSLIKGRICLEVMDQGLGIPKDKIEVIFERFGQVDSLLSRQAEGAGIGLSLVKRFVEALGGEIFVKSKVGYGSTFTVLLPDEKEEEDNYYIKTLDLMDNRLVQVTHVEFSDIYL